MVPLPATVEVPADNGDISFDFTPGAWAPEVAQDAALDGVLEVCLRAEVNTSGGEPRLGFVPELVGVPGTRRTGAGEVSAEDLDVTTASVRMPSPEGSACAARMEPPQRGVMRISCPPTNSHFLAPSLWVRVRDGLVWVQLPGPSPARAVEARNLSWRPLQRTSTRMSTSMARRWMSHISSVSLAAERPLMLSDAISMSGAAAVQSPWKAREYGPRAPTTVVSSALSHQLVGRQGQPSGRPRYGAGPSSRVTAGGARAGPRWVGSGGPVRTKAGRPRLLRPRRQVG